MRLFRFAAVIAFAFLVSACASSGGTAAPPPALSENLVDDYQIGIDDIVQVSVWRNPELGITVPVRPDAAVDPALLGDRLE